MTGSAWRDFDLDVLARLVRSAGQEVRRYFRKVEGHTLKADRSPITDADRTAHRVLVAGLQQIAPGFPVLSEEGHAVPYAERCTWGAYFLVDPLDGTREFVEGIPEFTVNLAWIEEGRPVLGLVHDPMRDMLYVGVVGQGAYLWQNGKPLALPRPDAVHDGVRVVLSRTDRSRGLAPLLARFAGSQVIRVGSSLKFCWIAAGRADFYPRLKPSMEWDTAAGTALVEAAGGRVLGLDGRPLVYNRKDMTNPPFYALSPGFMKKVPDWQTRLFSGPRAQSTA